MMMLGHLGRLLGIAVLRFDCCLLVQGFDSDGFFDEFHCEFSKNVEISIVQDRKLYVIV